MRSLWSNRCLVCRDRLGDDLALCRRCQTYLQAPESTCVVCGVGLSLIEADGAVCGQCLKSPPPFPQLTACCEWNEVVQILVHRLKYGGELVCARVFAEMFQRSMPPPVEGQLAPALVPVPLARLRMLSRGFNQAEEIARWYQGHRLGRLCDIGARRHRNTPPQSQLKKSERRANVRNCFRVPPRPKNAPEEVIVIDDLVTTTSTVSEFALALRRAGYEVRAVWCLARVD